VINHRLITVMILGRVYPGLESASRTRSIDLYVIDPWGQSHTRQLIPSKYGAAMAAKYAADFVCQILVAAKRPRPLPPTYLLGRRVIYRRR